MRHVLRAVSIAQHLQALAVFKRPPQQVGQPTFDALDDRMLRARKKHAVARARAVDFVATGLIIDGERTRQFGRS